MKDKKVCIAFLGNILYDTRTLNFYKSFKAENYNVEVISFDWLGSEKNFPDPNVKIYSLSKKHSSLFYYLKFTALLVYNLLKSNADIFFAEDIYTLPFIAVIAKLKGGKVFYDSRELFCFLAGLKERKRIQKLLASIEKRFINKADYVIVTGDMDGDFLCKQYGLAKTITIRNLPFYREKTEPVDLRRKYGIEAAKKVLVYQGVILHGRGLRHIFEFLKSNNDAVLIVFGDGEYKNYYVELSHSLGITDKVIFAGKIPQGELLNYSAGADIGLSLIENLSISYYYALPNKLFEYIMAGLPAAVSALPQMEKIVNDFETGIVVDLENQEEVNNKLNLLLKDNEILIKYRENCRTAAKELNWDNEIKKLLSLL